MVNSNIFKRLQERHHELRAGKEEILRAVREEDMLDQMLSFYAEGDSENDQMRDVLIERLSQLRAMNDEKLPRLEEEGRLGSLLSFYVAEADTDPEKVQQRRESQRLLARRQIRVREDQERREQDVRRHGELSATRLDAENRARREAMRAADIARVNASASFDALRTSLHQQIESLTTGVRVASSSASTAPAHGSPAYLIGNAVREYLIGHGLSSAPFTTLFTELPHIAESLPSTSEKAKIEAFRYHLRRSAKWFGLSYQRGIVELLPVDGESRMGGEATSVPG